MADPPCIAIKAAMVESSPQEPCWRSSKMWSMPQLAIASAATIEPRPMAYPYETSPRSIFCWAVLILVDILRDPSLVCLAGRPHGAGSAYRRADGARSTAGMVGDGPTP